MTVSFNGAEFGHAIAVASVVGSIVSFLIVALVIYLVVRPPRRGREEALREAERVDAQEMLALMERMERRLEVLERAVGDQTKSDRDQFLEAAEAPQTRRVK
jgi:large-conductance mechanosensitive channel